MPIPKNASAVPRPELGMTVMDVDLAMEASKFIGLQIAPVFESMLSAAAFKRIKADSLLRPVDTRRAATGAYPRGRFEYTDDSFSTTDHGYEMNVDERQAAILADDFLAEVVTARIARYTVLARLEKDILDALSDTTVWTGADYTYDVTTGAGEAWDVVESADPVADVERAMQAVRANSGFTPNVAVINWVMFKKLQRNKTSILDRIKYSGIDDPKTSAITARVIAQALGIERLIVSDRMTNSANEGQDVSRTDFWPSDRCLVAYVDPTNDLQMPTTARTIHWGGDGSNIGAAIESYGDPGVRGQIIRARCDRQVKVMDKNCAFLLTGLATP